MTPREEKDLLLRVITTLAGTQLKNGGLIPFGATLGPDRNVSLLMPDRMKRDVTRDELYAYWVEQLRRASADGNCKAACWCANVWLPGREEQMIPAVLVHVEIAGNCSEDIFYPYRNHEGSSVNYGEPITEAAEYQIFVSPRESSQ